MGYERVILVIVLLGVQCCRTSFSTTRSPWNGSNTAETAPLIDMKINNEVRGYDTPTAGITHTHFRLSRFKRKKTSYPKIPSFPFPGVSGPSSLIKQNLVTLKLIIWVKICNYCTAT